MAITIALLAVGARACYSRLSELLISLARSAKAFLLKAFSSSNFFFLYLPPAVPAVPGDN